MLLNKANYKSGVFFSLLIMFFLILLSGCNYNYFRGLELEKDERYEEANIEFHLAFTQSPNNQKFRDAYLRTAEKTTIDLLARYEIYVKEKKYVIAFQRLQQAQTLSPDHPKILKELKKWYRILLAGKVDLVQIKSLRNQIPLTDQIILEVRINSANITRVLEAPVDYQTHTFSVEDILYDPDQDMLMLYSINSIGVKLVKNSTGQKRFKKFVDFKTPVLVEVQGNLAASDSELTPVEKYYPLNSLNAHNDKQFWYPSRGIRYKLLLDKDRVRVNSSVKRFGFLPQILYMNKKDRRYFLDFGVLELFQKNIGGLWSFRRSISEDRQYLRNLQKNLMLNPYFFFREGGYPFVYGQMQVNK